MIAAPSHRALIVAGGLGSRMREKTAAATPKSLLEVGARSLIERNLRRAIASGADEIHFALRHEAERIEAHVRALRDVPISRCRFLREETPLGTIGALAYLRDADRPVLVMNADLFTSLDLRALLRRHAEEQADLTIATHFERHQLRFGEVLLDERGRIGAYVEKPKKAYRLASGTNVVGAEAMRLLTPAESIGFPTLVARALEAELHVAEYHHEAVWVDVNDANDLALARERYAEAPAQFEVDLA